ncbi:MAG TPA: hypothetical protein VLR94_12000 [Acidobacteriota bacterium]|nr:hypothetical protein [Acidobacteriota bacterium]
MNRAILLAAALAVLLLHNLAIRPWMLDDAFISFRYAENLASGNGPVYNVGERVEGYTCFLWVALLALGNRAGFHTPAAAQWLGCLFAAACVLLAFQAHRITRRVTPMDSTVTALLLGTCGAFTPWAISGMEVTLFAFLALLSMLLCMKVNDEPASGTALLLGAALALLSLTRPEGLLFTGILLTDALVGSKRRSFLIAAATFAVIFVPYFLWRYTYYGYLLPNTFYAKVGSTANQAVRGLRYTFRFIIAALPIIVAFLASTRTSWGAGFRSGVLVILSYTAYVIVVGGDIMPAFRFFAPVLPILCLIAASSICRITTERTVRLVILLTVAYNLFQIFYNPEIRDYILTDTVAADGKEAGLWLRQHARSGAVIATNTGGSLPYYSGLRSVDMLGLNDVRIAHRQIPLIGMGPAGHEKGDGAYVLSRQPDYIQFGSSLGDTIPRFLSDQELWKLPEFHRGYEMKTYRLETGKELILFERRVRSAP